MMNIFISYRRDDSEGYVGRLHDHLIQRYSRSEVFLDVDVIQAGAHWVEAIRQALEQCTAFIAVIGPRWLTITDAQGRRRLEQPDDYVRFEIATALQRDTLVIPALVQKATMPSAQDLPVDLITLTARNAIELSHDRFAYDVDRLVEAMGGAYGTVHIKGTLGLPSAQLRSAIHLTLHTSDVLAAEVMIDGHKAAKLQDGVARDVRVREGVHTIMISALGKGLSNTLTFRVKGGETARFTYRMDWSKKPYEMNRIVLEQQLTY